MTLRITVEDIESGDRDETAIREGDYLLVTHDPCWQDSVQVHADGRTHVITVKGRIPAPADPEEETDE